VNIEKPIFIIGVGRSGSTIFHQILSEHPHLAWLSAFNRVFPRQIWLNKILMRLIDVPFLKNLIRKNTKPYEVYPFWEYYVKGFSEPCKDLLAEDVTSEIKENAVKALSKNLTKKRNRLLIKITGWSRMGFLKEIFPDAKFIHVTRDGRAVANSLINVHWWIRDRSPSSWRCGGFKPSQEEEWAKYDKTPLALAAIEWKILMDVAEKDKNLIDSDDYMEIKYEDLCNNSAEIFQNVIKFCELKPSKVFDKKVSEYKLKNTNYKWQKELNDHQQKMLNEILHDHLKKYGFLE